MNNDKTKPNIDVKPDWFPDKAEEVVPEPDTFNKNSELWVTWHQLKYQKESFFDRFKRKTPSNYDPSTSYTIMYTTKEEAEANVVSADPERVWDGKPATSSTLQACMLRARKRGMAGVVIRGFRGGKWVQVAVFHCNQPLP